MTAPTYAASCLGDGHTPCAWRAVDPKSDLAARKHGEQTSHATTTHVAGGPFDQARKR